MKKDYIAEITTYYAEFMETYYKQVLDSVKDAVAQAKFLDLTEKEYYKDFVKQLKDLDL